MSYTISSLHLGYGLFQLLELISPSLILTLGSSQQHSSQQQSSQQHSSSCMISKEFKWVLSTLDWMKSAIYMYTQYGNYIERGRIKLKEKKQKKEKKEQEMVYLVHFEKDMQES